MDRGMDKWNIWATGLRKIDKQGQAMAQSQCKFRFFNVKKKNNNKKQKQPIRNDQ